LSVLVLARSEVTSSTEHVPLLKAGLMFIIGMFLFDVLFQCIGAFTDFVLSCQSCHLDIMPQIENDEELELNDLDDLFILPLTDMHEDNYHASNGYVLFE
jgi:hypothetical protein